MSRKYNCLLLVRISTIKQLHDSDSPEHQIKRGLSCAEQRFGIAKDQVFILTEAFSGRKEERPSLDQAFEMVSQYGMGYLLVYDIDRLTRAGAAHYEAIKRRFKSVGCDIVDVKGIIQPDTNTLEGTGGEFGGDFAYDWSVFAASEKAEVLEAQMAKDEARKILSRTIPIQINNAQQGRTNRWAPYGFKNIKIIDESGKPQPSKEPLEQEAFYVRRAYELVASNMDSRSISDELNQLGYQSRGFNKWSADRSKIIGHTGRNPMCPKSLLRMIERPVYAGFVCEKWTHGYPVLANHDGLVSLELWNLANKRCWHILQSSESPTGWELVDMKRHQGKRSYQARNPDFPFKALLHCHHCQKSLKGSFSKGKSGKRFGYYHCSRGHKLVSLNNEKAHKLLKSLLQECRFSPQAADRFEEHIRAIWVEKVGTLNKHLIDANKEVATLREECDALFEKIKVAQSPSIIKRLEDEYEDLQVRIKQLEAKRSKQQYCEADMNRVIEWARYLVEHLDELVLDGTNEGLRSLFWSLIFPEPVSLEQLKNRTPQISPLVRLKGDLQTEKGQLVRPMSFRSNTLTKELERWAEAIIPLFQVQNTKSAFSSLLAA
jgi:DNA invertase Pin-like site-specific DNA recombinase/uncharacterized coiled-coil protein SlyX